MEKLVNYTLGLFFITSLIFLQAFSLYRLPLLVFVVLLCFLYCLINRVKFNVFELLFYYFILASLSLLWCLIGFYYGNSNQALQESFLVYVVYPVIYLPVVVYLSSKNYKKGIDIVFFISSLGILLFAVYSVVDGLIGLNILPEVFSEQMLLYAGIHDGYTQLNNVNIGALCFILPYSVCRCLIEKEVSRVNIATVVFSLTAVFLASRRIIIFLFVVSPLVSMLIYMFSSKVVDFKIAKRVLRFYFFLFITFVTVAGYLITKDQNSFYGLYDRLTEVFVSDPHGLRTIQNEALLNSLDEKPIFGSGYGGLTTIIRSSERPWTFESTYHRLAFNGGVIGLTAVLLFFVIYGAYAVYRIRLLKDPFVSIALMVGLFSVMIASVTNPYLSSFDYIYSFSVIPLIVTSVSYYFRRQKKIE